MLSPLPASTALYEVIDMNIEQWLDNEKTIKKSQKAYTHFDYRTSMSTQKAYVTNPEKVCKHSFYPFIKYEKIYRKYNKKTGLDEKPRVICYAAHRDSCIFQYYSFLINEAYNQRVQLDGLNEVAVAYRTDLGYSNITLARKAIEYIRHNGPCIVMIGDFTGFFDNLDHQYLKKQLKNLLQVEHLSTDYYAVFKHVTKYSTWELSSLLNLNQLDTTRAGRKSFNSMPRALTPEQFSKNRNLIKQNENLYGIPQGSPISAVLANVYMLEIDQKINNLVQSNRGLYMRYSDDFIIVLPQDSTENRKSVIDSIKDIIYQTPGLQLEPRKTQHFEYTGELVVNCGDKFQDNSNRNNNSINFLGFSFDGKKVTLRSKTVSKYYQRMYRKAKPIAKLIQKNSYNKKIGKRNLYDRYSRKGASTQNNNGGNFLTYVYRADKIFEFSEDISKDTARHMSKIKKALRKGAHKATPL